MAMPNPAARDNVPTAIAIGIIAYAVAVLSHEGLGHGSVCAILTSRPFLVTTAELQCPESSRAVAAAGPLLNLIIGLALLPLLVRSDRFDVRVRFFIWFVQGYNIFMTGGYFLFSGCTGVGDWAIVFAGIEPQWLIRALEVAFGGAMYYGAARISARLLVGSVLGTSDAKRVLWLVVVPYCGAGISAVAAAACSGDPWLLIVVSAIPSAFGGGAAFVWMMSLVPPLSEVKGNRAAMPLLRDYRWITAGVAIFAIFVFIFGPGVTL